MQIPTTQTAVTTMPELPKSQTPLEDPRFSENEVAVTSPWRAYSRFDKYDETFPIMLYELASEGKTDAEIAKEMKCSKATLMRWVAEEPEMTESYQLASTSREAKFDCQIRQNMIATEPQQVMMQTDHKFVDLYAKSNFDKFNDKKQDEKSDKDNEREALNVISELMSQFKRVANQEQVALKKIEQLSEQNSTVESDNSEEYWDEH